MKEEGVGVTLSIVQLSSVSSGLGFLLGNKAPMNRPQLLDACLHEYQGGHSWAAGSE